MKVQMKPGTNPSVTVSAGANFTYTFQRDAGPVDVLALAAERVGSEAGETALAQEASRVGGILLDSGWFEPVAE